MDRILENLRKGAIFVATVDGEGRPQLRPFGAAIRFEDGIYIFTSKDKSVYRQMTENPNVQIVSMVGEMEWQRLTAKVELDDRAEIVQAFLDYIPELADYYAPNDGHAAPMKLTEITATVYRDSEVLEEIS
jgi:uncharacterized pyridoxamine 5'-phosphate oxidase family protein